MKKEGFNLSSSGGAMMGDIQQITLDYEICLNLNVEEARILFIKHAEALLFQINNDLEIRRYLHNYPFTSRNIFFKLTFSTANGAFVDPPYIAFVTLDTKRNFVRYLVHDIKNDSLKTVYEEPYDDALRIYHETLKGK